MPKVKESIRIERPVEEVFAYATDPTNQTQFATNIIRFEADTPRLEKGTRMEGATRVAGKTVEWTSECIEIEENHRVTMRSIEAPMDFELTWTYERDDDATLVSFEQTVPETGGFFGKLTDSIVTKMYSRDVRSNLENLKTLLEEA